MKRAIWVLLAGLALAGCDDGGEEKSGEQQITGPVSFATDVQPIFSANCSAYCHLGAGAGYLDLLPGAAFSSLVEVDALCDPGAIPRVDPGSPESSVLWRRLSGDPDLCGGNPMPPGGPLSAGELAIIERWVLDGALDN